MSATTGQPVPLALDAGPVLVFPHLPDGGWNDTAVLLIPPFGWQEACSYRGLKPGRGIRQRG
jgi:hypothetical protein